MSELAENKLVEVTREHLYRQVWSTPMTKLAVTYGLSGNGLAKICDRLNIPYPPRGYWAKLAAGKKVVAFKLPDRKDDTPDSVIITPTPPPPEVPKLPAEVQQKVDGIRARDPIVVAQRLSNPHAIVAKWIEKYEQDKREAQMERDLWRKKFLTPSPLTDLDRRRHRILNALFKELEKYNGVVKENDRRELCFVSKGETISFLIREKLKQVRRPATQEEGRWRKTVQELQPTGRLMLEIKTYLPKGFKRQWIETDENPFEELLSDIVANFVAAIPLMEQASAARAEQERLERIESERRRKLEEEQRLTKNRVRRFTEIAKDWKDRQVAWEFLTALKATFPTFKTRLSGCGVDDWIAWMEKALVDTDPANSGVESVLSKVAEVNSWTYRD